MNTMDRSLENTLLKFISDKYFNNKGEEIQGDNVLNTNIANYDTGVNPVVLFSGGTQILDNGVRCFVIRGDNQFNQYGVNSSKDYNTTLMISIMLTNGSYDKDAWNERIVYENALLDTLEQFVTNQCNMVLRDLTISYLTKGGESFDIFESIGQVIDKKILAKLVLYTPIVKKQ